MADSKIFPDAAHTITVYVPAEYTGSDPACTLVVLDGLLFHTPVVLDNLIAQHAMPVTVAIGVSPGVVNSATPPANPRFDRSLEFDSLNDRFARFLLDEVIPAVERHRTPDGIQIRLSTSADDRAIAGASTGGIGAFTVAWQRPNAFHRVFTAIGTFVGMRGGERYYVLVRKTEPKPLRIFMEDGVHDEWLGGPEMGDWWLSNLTMSRALEFAGYDVRHVWGDGTHSGAQAAAIFPEVMRWLWRGWPAPVTARPSGNPVLKEILKVGASWQLVATGCDNARTLASDSRGQVFYRIGRAPGVARLKSTGMPEPCETSAARGAFAFGPDDKLYMARPGGGIEVLADEAGRGTKAIRAKSLAIRSLMVRSNGDIYSTTFGHDGRNDLWLVPARGKEKRLDNSLRKGTGIATSPDGLWLFVAQKESRYGISYRVLADGSLDAREPFYDFYVPARADDGGASEIAMDRSGRAYVATRTGVQVFDRNGRVTAILPLPGNEEVTGICFGGKDFNLLYVLGGGKVYTRKLNAQGAPPWAAPSKLPPWGAG
ncbi:MAG: SMP-30/gluconolactonase/LRE family protein [Terriglobia bacterium]